MILSSPAIIAMALAGLSLPVWYANDAGRARKRAILGTLAGALLALISFAVPLLLPLSPQRWIPQGALALAPLITALVAVIAVAMAPRTSHDPATLVRMMWLFALAEGFFATDEVWLLLLLWGGQALLVWTDLRRQRQGQSWQRVFGLYQLASFVCVACGVLFWGGRAVSAVPLLVLLVGMATRLGIVPLHSWFPRFVEQAPLGLVVAFSAPQPGLCAHLASLHQSGLSALAPFVASIVGGCAATTAVLAAALGVVQRRSRRALAYLIMSQTGMIVLGAQSNASVGITGAQLAWQVLAIATSGFTMAMAALEAQRGPLRLTIPHGNFAQTPRLGIAFLVLGCASVGFPLSMGFVAEDLLVHEAFSAAPLLGISLIVATAFNGVTVLRAFFFLFTGERRVTGAPDLSRREAAALGFAMITVFAFGLLPGPLVAFERAAGGARPSSPVAARHPRALR